MIPWVLAFQGDNPMSSEFASHIGMKEKYLCRVCHISNTGDKEVASEEARVDAFMTVRWNATFKITYQAMD